MQKRRFRHPPFDGDVSLVFNNNLGRKLLSDACSIVSATASSISTVTAAASSMSRIIRETLSLKVLRCLQHKRSPWRQHKTLASEGRGNYCYSRCSALAESSAKRGRSYKTYMGCKEYSIVLGRNMWLCNGTKGEVAGKKRTWVVCLCQVEYHKLMFDNK